MRKYINRLPIPFNIPDIAELLVQELVKAPEDRNTELIDATVTTLDKAYTEINKEKSIEKRDWKIINTAFELPYPPKKVDIDKNIGAQLIKLLDISMKEVTMADVYELLDKKLGKDAAKVDLNFIYMSADALGWKQKERVVESVMYEMSAETNESSADNAVENKKSFSRGRRQRGDLKRSSSLNGEGLVEGVFVDN